MKANKEEAAQPFERRKINPQKLNMRPASTASNYEQRLDNPFQNSLLEEQLITSPEEGTEEHAVFQHEHNYGEEKKHAASHAVASVDYGHSRATNFADFINEHGQNSIVISEILGKPKGWE